MENKALNESELNQVSGGAVFGRQVGKTSGAGEYPVDESGNVLFTDKTGRSIALTAKEWTDLKSHYTYTGGDPEVYIKTVPISELAQAGLIKLNPFGL